MKFIEGCNGAVRTRLEDLVRRRACAGLQYLVTVGGEVVMEHCVGWADSALGTTVTPQTTFNLYSITKVFTAAAALLAAEGWALDLESPIAAAAGMPPTPRFGTVHETLLHRGGFPNPMPLRWFHPTEEDATFDEAQFVTDRLQGLASHRPRPGTYRYSNIGYLAVGRALERAGGDTFRNLLQTHVIASLGQCAGAQLGFDLADVGYHARGHVFRRSLLGMTLGWWVDRRRIVETMGPDWIQLRPHHVNGSAYGGLVGNARGLAAFGHAALGIHDGWSPRVREQLTHTVAGPGPSRTPGWFVGRLGHVEWLAHAGGGLGGYGELRVYPAHGAVSTLLTNGPGLRDRRALDTIDAAWIGRPNPRA